MQPFVDVWGWFIGHRVQAQREHNPDLLRLVDMFQEMFESLEPDPNHSLALCNEAIGLARQLKMPCMELYYQNWRCETYLFYLRQLRAGLREATTLALETRKPEYERCPVVARVYRNLMNAYHFLDSYGYADEIAAVLDFLENDFPIDKDTWKAIAWERAWLAAANEDFEQAFDLTEVYRARCGDDQFYLIHAYTLLCWLSYKLKRFELIEDFAEMGEACARSQNRHESLANLLGWKAFALYRAGRKAEARRTAGEAVRQHQNVPTLRVHEAPLMYYYEVSGDLEKALRVHRGVLDFELEAGSADGETQARLEICKTMAKMNLPLAEELALARKSAEKLRRPDRVLDKLDRLERGEILD